MPEMTSRNFCKLAKDFGIKLCGDRTAKKWAVYGHDNEGFFYCDIFPSNYNGNNPMLHIERFKNHEWVRVDEKSRTTQMIYQVYIKSGKLAPMSYSQLDCKHNRKVAEAKKRREFQKDISIPWRLQYGKHGSYCDGFPTDFCNWKKENSNLLSDETIKIKRHISNGSTYEPDEYTEKCFCHTDTKPKCRYTYWAFNENGNLTSFTKAHSEPYKIGQKVTIPKTKEMVEIFHFEKGETVGECAQ